VLSLIEQRILAARSDHDIFHAIAVHIAHHAANFLDDGEVLSEAPLHEVVVNLRSILPLSKGGKEQRDDESQKKHLVRMHLL